MLAAGQELLPNYYLKQRKQFSRVKIGRMDDEIQMKHMHTCENIQYK